MINIIVIHANEAFCNGGKVVLFHRDIDDRMVEDEIVSTKAELEDFIGRHFPGYLKETDAVVDTIRRECDMFLN